MSFRPFQQGDLDGLCGLYAVANAVHALLEVAHQEPAFSEKLFEVTARAVPRSDYPDVLFEGVDTDRLFRIAQKVRRHLADTYDFAVEVWRPFENRRFKTAAACLEEMEELWSQTPTTFIIGVDWAGTGQGGHWTALKEIKSDRLVLHDSSKTPKLSRHALSLSGVTKHRLCPGETIAFRLGAIAGELVR